MTISYSPITRLKKIPGAAYPDEGMPELPVFKYKKMNRKSACL